MAKKKKPVKRSAVRPGKSAKSAAQKSAKASTGKKQAGSKRVASKAVAVSLGRPKVTAEEKLYMLFKDDYQARQLFEFLQVASVGELEQFSPAEIVDRLSQPLRQTVQRIRKLLAGKNRSLRGDSEFAAKHASAAEEAEPT